MFPVPLGARAASTRDFCGARDLQTDAAAAAADREKPA
jgi:hypothetical protein